MDPKVIAALIAALGSLVIAVVSAAFTARNARRVHVLEEDKLRLGHRLESQRAVADARRDYEYVARKRLYQQCEPVIFQATIQAEGFVHRIASIARSARNSNIRPDGSGWLSHGGYYFNSTIYLLLAPLTSARMLQRRLTSIDMALEPRIRAQFELLQILYRGFTEDFEMARALPVLRYDPDRADPGVPDRERLLAENPGCYRRQGLYLGVVEVLADALLTDDGSRCRSYGEFLAAMNEPDSRLATSLEPVREGFIGFHPLNHPVLWRVLVMQYFHYQLFLQTANMAEWRGSTAASLGGLDSDVTVKALEWRPDSEYRDIDVLEPIRIARNHVEKTLANLDKIRPASNLSRSIVKGVGTTM